MAEKNRKLTGVCVWHALTWTEVETVAVAPVWHQAGAPQQENELAWSAACCRCAPGVEDFMVIAHPHQARSLVLGNTGVTFDVLVRTL